jgi:hypothetical protein
MRFLATVLTAALGAGVLWMAGGALASDDADRAPVPVSIQAVPAPAFPAPASADQGLNAPAQPGNDAEARNYAQRQAESPEAQEFAGGHVIVFFGGLIFLALVALIVILILQHENKI